MNRVEKQRELVAKLKARAASKDAPDSKPAKTAPEKKSHGTKSSK